MPEVFQRFLGWYLAPWRRMSRRDFGIALLVVSLPSLIAALAGARHAIGFLGPLLDVLLALKGIGSGSEAGAALDAMNNAMGAFPAGGEDTGFNGFAFLNNLLLLALFPLCRMRLRDMGKTGRQELGWAVALNLGVVNSLGLVVFGVSLLPLGWVWSLLNFGGYIWLSTAKGGTQLAVHERMDYTLADKPDSLPPRKTDDDLY